MGAQSSISSGNDTANKLARRDAPSHPQSYVVSFLLHLIFTRFKDSKRIVSSKFFDERVTSVSIGEFVLPYHALSVLSYLCCSKHSLLLNSYLERIGRIVSHLCSGCDHPTQDISHLILHFKAADSLRL